MNKLPVEVNKLFSTKKHTHIKKALKAQRDVITLAEEGDEEAVMMRNIMIATIGAVEKNYAEQMVLYWYLSRDCDKDGKRTLIITMEDEQEFPLSERMKLVTYSKEITQLKKKSAKQRTAEENARLKELEEAFKPYEYKLEVIANGLLDKMMNAFHAYMKA